MGHGTLPNGYLNKIGFEFFDETFKDCSSNYPEQNCKEKLGGQPPYKINIVSMGRRGNL
jgi:hypothetical protein